MINAFIVFLVNRFKHVINRLGGINLTGVRLSSPKTEIKVKFILIINILTSILKRRSN